jgi:transposase-like protein
VATKAKAKSKPKAVKGTRATKYTEDEKKTALEMIIACNGSVAEAARRASLSYEVLYAWSTGRNVSPEVYEDYTLLARARVRERLDAMHASKDEVLSLLAEHLRADIADLTECFTETGSLDLSLAKQIHRSRIIKKLKHRRIPVRDRDGEVVDYEHITELELHDSQSAAGKLMQIHGLVKQPGENPDDIAAKREYWKQQIDELCEKHGFTATKAKNWLLANVEAARIDEQWIH